VSRSGRAATPSAMTSLLGILGILRK
jgi:hypothetical protein